MLDVLLVGIIVIAAAFFVGWRLRRSAQGRSCHEVCGTGACACAAQRERQQDGHEHTRDAPCCAEPGHRD